MKNTRKKMAACVATALSVVLVAGVQAKDDQTQTGSSSQRTPSATYEKGKSYSSSNVAPTPANKVSSLVGMGVKDISGEKLGDIKDVIIDTQSGKVAYTIFGTDGKERLFAVPLSAYQPSSDHKHLILAIDKQKFESAKGFDKKSYPSINSPGYEAEMFWIPGRTAVNTSANESGKYNAGISSTGKDSANRGFSGTGAPMDYNKGSKLIGMNVKNQHNDNLGEIKEVVVDFGTETVSYVVLGSGGALGIGEKMFAVPLQAFSLSTDQKHLVLNANKDRLQTAQGFDKNSWPSVNNPSWGANVFWENDATRGNISNGLNRPGSDTQRQNDLNLDNNRPKNPDLPPSPQPQNP